MKWERKTAAIVTAVFAISLASSILFSFGMINLNVYNVKVLGAQTYTVQPYVELAYILVSLLLVTAAMLLMIRRNMSKLISGLFAFISFFVLIEFYSVFFFSFVDYIGQYVGLIALVAAALTVVYYFKYAGSVARNVINVFIFITISAVMAAALGPYPSLILIGVIAVYDYISVFITKHMLTLAKGLKGKGFLAGLTFMARSTKRVGAMLGGGDVVFPAILVNAMFFEYSALAGILALIAAVLGLSLIIFFGKKGKVYPAMAVIGPLQILFFGAYALAVIL